MPLPVIVPGTGASPGQRTTGRRAQRRRAREDTEHHQHGDDEAAAQSSESIDDSDEQQQQQQQQQGGQPTGTDSVSTSPSANETKRKGPSDAIQSRIDAAVSARSGHGVGTAASQSQHAAARQEVTCMMDPNILEGGRYEYLDHTADVQLHSWGTDLPSALEQAAVAMFGYMTSLPSISIDARTSDEVASHVVARGHDLHSMVFAFLDEWLFVFHDTGFVAREVEVVHLDREGWQITSRGRGEILDLDKHPQGTEVKAITYSNMQIQEKEGGNADKDGEERCDVWVIVDI